MSGMLSLVAAAAVALHVRVERPFCAARSACSAGASLERARLARVPHARMASAPITAALLFDCDGVLVETEELHRVAYNMAFEKFGLQIDGAPVVWSNDYYAFLANTVGGGKPKMRYHFTGLGAPDGAKTHPDTAKTWPAVTTRDGFVPADEAAGMLLVDDLQVCTASPRPTLTALL